MQPYSVLAKNRNLLVIIVGLSRHSCKRHSWIKKNNNIPAADNKCLLWYQLCTTIIIWYKLNIFRNLLYFAGGKSKFLLETVNFVLDMEEMHVIYYCCPSFGKTTCYLVIDLDISCSHQSHPFGQTDHPKRWTDVAS